MDRRMTTTKPTPGSPAAIKAGCTCPVIDNAHGHGIRINSSEPPVFWHNSECPLHGTKQQPKENDA
jgi:hypothetical protein